MILRARQVSSGLRRAFSLVEVLVVVAIIAVTTTGAVAIYSRSLQSAPVRTSAEKVKSLLVNARSQAIADEAPSQIVFDLTNDQMWIDTLTAAGDMRQAKAVAPVFFGPNVVIEEVRIGGIPFNTGYAVARFEATGVNPLISVHLRRDTEDATNDENYYTVQLWPSSGQPRVTPRARR